jgi:hypothetical protein
MVPLLTPLFFGWTISLNNNVQFKHSLKIIGQKKMDLCYVTCGDVLYIYLDQGEVDGKFSSACGLLHAMRHSLLPGPAKAYRLDQTKSLASEDTLVHLQLF